MYLTFYLRPAKKQGICAGSRDGLYSFENRILVQKKFLPECQTPLIFFLVP